MKSSGYALKDSLCELIDNSLWHGKAKNVEIKISWNDEISKNSRPYINEVCVADNGTGMNVERLEKAVKIGGSNTYGSSTTFGRFGFGMMAGAITQCNFIEIYSKENGDWNYLQYDVKKIASGEWKEIPDIVTKSPPEKYTAIIKETGTIIIWSQFDSADVFNSNWNTETASGKNKNADLGNLFWELGRIYRKTIGEKIVKSGKIRSVPIVDKNDDLRIITLNGKKLIPMDPLYMLKIPNFENDPDPTLVMDELILSIPVHPLDKERAENVEEDDIHIRITILNEKWRQRTADGNKNPRQAETQQRMMHKNEGMSILRQGREVWYGKVPGITLTQTKTEDRYWGCEIDFPATLDKRFGIRNVKIGIGMDQELQEKLKSVLSGPIADARREIDLGFKKSKSVAAKKSNATPHDEATGRFKDTDVGTNPKSEQITEEEKQKLQEDLVARFSSFDQKVDREKFGEIGVVFQDDIKLSENNPFVEVRSNLGNNIVIYNLQHPFFAHLDEVYRKLEEMGTEQTIESLLGRPLTNEEEEFRASYQKQVGNTRYLIDLLLGSVAAAKGEIDHDIKQLSGSTLNSLFSRWTDNLFTVANDKNFGRRI